MPPPHARAAGRGRTYQAPCWLHGGPGAFPLGASPLDCGSGKGGAVGKPYELTGTRAPQRGAFSPRRGNLGSALLAFGLAAARRLPDAPASGVWSPSLCVRPSATLQQFRMSKIDADPSHGAEAAGTSAKQGETRSPVTRTCAAAHSQEAFCAFGCPRGGEILCSCGSWLVLHTMVISTHRGAANRQRRDVALGLACMACAQLKPP
jgi:hypothetical protein